MFHVAKNLRKSIAVPAPAILRRPVRKLYTPGAVHYNAPLTTFAIGYMQSQEGFVARRALTPVPVTKQSNVYYIWDRASQNRDDFEKRAPSTEAPVLRKSRSTDTYFADRWSLAYDIDSDERDNADEAFNNLEQDATMSLMFKGLLRQEIEFANTFMVSTPWTYVKTGAAATPGTDELLQWNDSASDPIGDVSTARTTIQLASGGFRPNILVLGQQVADKLALHPDFIDRVKYGGTNGQPALINRQAMAALFDVEEVLIMSAVKNASPEGVAESNQFIGGRSALLAYRGPAGSTTMPTYGSQFNWTKAGVGQEGVQIKVIPMPKLDADRVEGNMWFDQKVTGADLGYLFDDIVAA